MVKRTKGIVKIIRKVTGKMPSPKYVIAGDKACWRMVQEARSLRQPGPSDRAILAWAKYDLTREIMTGFWELQAA